MSELARRARIQIGVLEVEGFMLPDGSYRMSQSQAAEIVGLSERNARDFLSSKAFKSLRGEGYTPAIFEIDEVSQGRGQSRFNALDLDVVITYWTWQCFRGNKQALTLLIALATETLERRFDTAFGVARSEQDRDERLASTLEQMEGYLKEAMDYEVLAQADSQYLRNWIAQMGYDPDDLPNPRDEQ